MEIDKIANGTEEFASDDHPPSSPMKEKSLSSPMSSPEKENVVVSPKQNEFGEGPSHESAGGDRANVSSSATDKNLPSPMKLENSHTTQENSPIKQDDSSIKQQNSPLISHEKSEKREESTKNGTAIAPQIIHDAPRQVASNDECSEAKKSKPICTVEPKTLSPGCSSSAADLIHRIKWFTWHGTKTPIITQNENGPCPLLAVMNVLLLRGQVNLPDELEVVTSQNLMERLGDCILRLTPTEFAQRPDYQQNISDAIAVLPKLMTGLDVNVKFTGVSEFEFTPECIVFDLLNIPLYHGWLVEPENQEAQKVINSLSYNQLVEKIIDYKGSGDSLKVSEALFAEQFLESSASQLTYHGLYELNHRLKDGELAVFFRNNHFSSLVKHDTGLFLLVTDQGFLNEKAVVWETLNNIEGDSKFLDSEFKELLPKTEALVPLAESASPQEQIDHDLMVAMSLDDQERQAAPTVEVVEEYDRQLALQLQEEENRAGSPEASNSQERQNIPSPTESSGGKKKDRCEIL